MIIDYITNISINNDKTKLENNNMYAGNYHIIINCINANLNAYFILSKFNILDSTGAIHRMNHSNTSIQIEVIWEMNQPIEIFTRNNPNNDIFNVELKIYYM